MAPRRKSSSMQEEFPVDVVENIVDVDVSAEMETSFLEYSYSVIYSRALPDARDGLKPVQRRILYMMTQMGLRPDKGHVKSARVVGEVMGKLHPHGDAAIYDAMVRLAQSFAMRLPLVDGHGNFGSVDDGPAAARYTEARMAPAALAMTGDLDEDVVDFVPNYDNQFTQPGVLPSAFPNLLVNGSSGIAVGMATNMAPHNLREVIAGAQHLITHPQATLEDVMAFIPGPDLPTGGTIVGLSGIRDAYASGRGSFKTRAKVSIEQVTARKQGLVITELPYMVGPEKIIEKIKDGVQAKKLSGISDVVDLTDRKHGTRLHVLHISTADELALFEAGPLVDADGNRVEQFEPGLIAYARGGKDIRFNQPSATGGYGEYKRASLHTISAGFRVLVRDRDCFAVERRESTLRLSASMRSMTSPPPVSSSDTSPKVASVSRASPCSNFASISRRNST